MGDIDDGQLNVAGHLRGGQADALAELVQVLQTTQPGDALQLFAEPDPPLPDAHLVIVTKGPEAESPSSRTTVSCSPGVRLVTVKDIADLNSLTSAGQVAAGETIYVPIY